jgi:hypothetical protein
MKKYNLFFILFFHKFYGFLFDNSNIIAHFLRVFANKSYEYI